MKKFLIVAAVAVFGATGAQAADLRAPVYTKAPAMTPISSWTGFYAGVNVGYGFDDPTVSFAGGDPLIAQFISGTGGQCCGSVPASQSFNIGGITGGVQAGYNWQFAPQWVGGIETDFNGSNFHNTVSSFFNLGNGFGFRASLVASQSVDWFGTLRARVGWLPTSNLLVYGTGGLAYGQIKNNLVFNGTGSDSATGYVVYGYQCSVTGANCFTGSSSTLATGYALGGGSEYAAWKNVTLKAEYLYVNLGSSSTRAVAGNSNAQPQAASFIANFSDYHFHVLRVGANYRF